jgi:hypothetical protein
LGLAEPLVSIVADLTLTSADCPDGLEGWESYQPWANFSKKDEIWAVFSTLEVAACMLFAFAAMKQNSLT